MADTAQPSQQNVCLVCGLSCRTHFHFGGASCTACASFFRRTVSLNIRYVCKRENDCISSPEMRSICRACRYECCINKAVVQQRRNDKRTPKYVLNSRVEGSGEIVRDYTTNSYTTLHEFPQGDSKETSPTTSPSISEDSDEFSKILDVSHMALLDYYVKQVEIARKVKNTLQVRSISELLEVMAIQNELAIEACTMCPGADILDREDVEVLLKYFQFANTWMDSLWAYSVDPTIGEDILDEPLSEFIAQVKSTVGSSFAHLKLNIYEFAALKSFCIWKLGVHDTTISMKIVAQEQYLGVTAALRKYYETTSNMCDTEIATRIAEITLQIVPVFSVYHDMVQFYHQVGLPTHSVFEEC
uniref:Nuclear receptor domain-containing protein n=1 Tax=Caenorhabditis tropicalis TaxID=1561998 RepID=A0A1I7UBM8_9PELO